MHDVHPSNQSSKTKHVRLLQDALATKNSSDELRIIRLKELMRRLGLSRSSIYTLIRDGQLNAPISLSARAVGWLESDISSFIAARVKASRADSKGAAA